MRRGRGRGQSAPIGSAATNPFAVDPDTLEGWTAEDVLCVGQAITTFAGQLGLHDATQANAAYQCELIDSHAALGGRRAARAHGSVDYYDIDGLGSPANWSVWVVADRAEGELTHSYLYYSLVAGIAIEWETYPNTDLMGEYDGDGHKPVAGATCDLGGQSVCWDYTSATQILAIYRAGAQLGQANFVVARSFSWPGYVFGAPGAAPSDTYWRHMWIVGRSASVSDRSAWFRWSLLDSGV